MNMVYIIRGGDNNFLIGSWFNSTNPLNNGGCPLGSTSYFYGNPGWKHIVIQKDNNYISVFTDGMLWTPRFINTINMNPGVKYKKFNIGWTSWFYRTGLLYTKILNLELKTIRFEPRLMYSSNFTPPISGYLEPTPTTIFFVNNNYSATDVTGNFSISQAVSP